MLKHTILVAAVAGLVLALAPAAQADLKEIDVNDPLVPSVLGVNDTFHLVFVTSTSRASNVGMADYNKHVNDAAGYDGSLFKVKDWTWFAIASISTKNAKDNAVVTAPVYIWDDSGTSYKVADDAADMWNGSIDSPINLSEKGLSLSSSVMTGSDAAGVVKNGGLNSWYVQYGNSDSINSTWIDDGNAGKVLTLPLYALSEELQVIPEPASAVLLLIGAPLLALRRRRK